tara:strand:+ start:297 stop:593 length:297 start_codon:yes stop_codon:yes gene_type:complete
MLLIKYCWKDSKRTLESADTLKYRSYSKTVAKAIKYNKDVENDIFISEITDLNTKPRHTTVFTYTPCQALTPYILRGKHNTLGGNAFNCIYNIPIGEI